MEICTLKELRSRFEVHAEQAFAKWHAQLTAADARSDVKELYSLIKYRLPEEVQEWMREEIERSGREMAEQIRLLSAAEGQTESHPEVLERVQMRLDSVPAVERPYVGPNHLFNQAFSTFGLISGCIYVGTSYLAIPSVWFEPARILCAVAIGAVGGRLAYQRYRQRYREEFRELGEVFLERYRQRMRDWYGQLVSLSEGEIEFSDR